mmetsp:Transcript_4396/g.7680  ORF Transcript_4396/g.7680 Transcript_4396/m.7680 type:complete len:273 (-) Transcript_4396:78-896(-)
MCDPLTQLRLEGFFCPCNESEGDYVARMGAVTLQAVPVQWYREVRNDGSVKASTLRRPSSNGDSPSGGNSSNDIFDSVVNGFNRGVDTVAKALALDDLPPEAYLTSYVGIDAKLSIGSGPKGPSIIVTPTSILTTPENFYDFYDEDDSGLQKGTKRTSASKTVALCEVSEVVTGDGFFNQRGRVSCGVRVLGLPDANGILGAVGFGKNVLLFDVEESTVHNVTRDEVVHHLNNLLEWDRNRRNPRPKAEQSGEGDFVIMGSDGDSRRQVGRR